MRMMKLIVIDLDLDIRESASAGPFRLRFDCDLHRPNPNEITGQQRCEAAPDTYGKFPAHSFFTSKRYLSIAASKSLLVTPPDTDDGYLDYA